MAWLNGRMGGAILWILTILGAVTMELAGFSKFANPALWQSRFAAWGYPAGFAEAIGGVEMLAAALLCAPRVARYAACMLAAVMLGALYTVLTKGSSLGWGAALAQLTVMSAIAVLRFRRGAGAQPTRPRISAARAPGSAEERGQS
jgi:uncharacterized membrane protein YphA (DoxX/SURF4 family)